MKKEKKNIYEELESGKINIVVGTHALIQENVKFNKAEAKQLWNYLFTHQNQIMALKQKRFDF